MKAKVLRAPQSPNAPLDMAVHLGSHLRAHRATVLAKARFLERGCDRILSGEPHVEPF